MSLSVLFVVLSLRFNGLRSHGLALNVKNSAFLVPILDQSLAQGRLQLEPFRLAGVVTLHGIAGALISNFVRHCL